MFRNTYLQTYKSAYSKQSSLQTLLCHFNHLYITMGSIVQDIEFQISLIISSGTHKIKNQQIMKHQEINNSMQSQKQRQKDRQILQKEVKKLQKEKQILSRNSKKSVRFSDKPELQNVSKPINKIEKSKTKDSSYDELFPTQFRRSSNSNPVGQVKNNKNQQLQNERLDELDDVDFMDNLFRKRK